MLKTAIRIQEFLIERVHITISTIHKFELQMKDSIKYIQNQENDYENDALKNK